MSENQEFETVPGLLSARIKVERFYSRYGWLVSLNEAGYRVCEYCGASASLISRSLKSGHKNPITGLPCKGKIQTVNLGHRFMTDVLELRFVGDVSDSMSVWQSTLFALLEGASSAIGIRREDIDGLVELGAIPRLMIYDNVPGGAGYTRAISERLLEVFQSALERVSRDCCGLETSCYQCLRNYYNQMWHEQLSRGLAKSFLEQMIASK
jgi:hypothetical protein